MKTISKFINYQIQEELIKLVIEEKFPHRIKPDRSIESAKKWVVLIEELCNILVLDLFENPVLNRYSSSSRYNEYISLLAKHNIFFISFVIGVEITVVIDDNDVDYICDYIDSSILFETDN